MLRAWFLCSLAYVTAAAAAAAVIIALRGTHPIVAAAIADTVATIVVFVFSRALDNSSIYDPYWSVAPLGILTYWWVAAAAPMTLRIVWVFGCVLWWGARLTYNWLRRWQGLGDEDWRYVDLRREHGGRYWIVSFFGIHLFPTALVFVGCVPAYFALTSSAPLSIFDAVALGVTVAAIVVETVADRQLHDFLSDAPEPRSFLASGLWRYSRHPNYFGEVVFWWGLALFGLTVAPDQWWLVAGATAITLLFWFVSIPMIDARMRLRRHGYREHEARTSALLPRPPKRTDRTSE